MCFSILFLTICFLDLSDNSPWNIYKNCDSWVLIAFYYRNRNPVQIHRSTFELETFLFLTFLVVRAEGRERRDDVHFTRWAKAPQEVRWTWWTKWNYVTLFLHCKQKQGSREAIYSLKGILANFSETSYLELHPKWTPCDLRDIWNRSEY